MRRFISPYGSLQIRPVHGAGRLAPLYRKLIDLFHAEGVAEPGQRNLPLTPAEAFVLTHAVAGVVRTLVADDDNHLPSEAVEQALTQLVLGFLKARRAV